MFCTDCAINASHLEIIECRMVIVWPREQDRYSDAITQGRTPPLSSHAVLQAHRLLLHYWGHATGKLDWCPHCQQGHQFCCFLMAHTLDGVHVAKCGSGNTSTSVCVRACVCVCVCVILIDYTAHGHCIPFFILHEKAQFRFCQWIS